MLVEYLFSSFLNKLLNQFAISLWNNPASFTKNTEIIRSKYFPFYRCFCLEGKKIQKCCYIVDLKKKWRHPHLSLNTSKPFVLLSLIFKLTSLYSVLSCTTGLCKPRFLCQPLGSPQQGQRWEREARKGLDSFCPLHLPIASLQPCFLNSAGYLLQ